MPSTLKAGPLRSRITIEAPTVVSDNAGGSTTTWSTFATVWAHREFVGGGDRIEAEQIVSRDVPTFTIRRRTDITIRPAMRVRDHDEIFAITSIAADDVDRSMVVLTCEQLLTEPEAVAAPVSYLILTPDTIDGEPE